MQTKSLLALLALPALALGLATTVLGGAPAARAADDPDFALTVSAADLKVGLPGAIVVKVDVKGGYHWNDDYPARFEVSPIPAGLSLPKPALSQLAGDFKAESPTAVTVTVPAVATAAVKVPVTVNAKFSVCNDKVCLMKKATATVQITAK